MFWPIDLKKRRAQRRCFGLELGGNFIPNQVPDLGANKTRDSKKWAKASRFYNNRQTGCVSHHRVPNIRKHGRRSMDGHVCCLSFSIKDRDRGAWKLFPLQTSIKFSCKCLKVIFASGCAHVRYCSERGQTLKQNYIRTILPFYVNYILKNISPRPKIYKLASYWICRRVMYTTNALLFMWKCSVAQETYLHSPIYRKNERAVYSMFDFLIIYEK